MLQVIVGHGEPAPRLCNKDPFALKSLSYLARIFPKAKFVLMLRDGRAAVHSMISRKVGFLFMFQHDCSRLLFRQALDCCHIVTHFCDYSLLWLVFSVYLMTLFTGDHLWLRPEQLQGLSDQVEQCSGDHVQPVPGSWWEQMPSGPLRAACPSPRGGNEKVASLPRPAMGPISAAPWTVDWKGRWCVSVQVST